MGQQPYLKAVFFDQEDDRSPALTVGEADKAELRHYVETSRS